MGYVVTMNGKECEVEVKHMSTFHILTHGEIASGVLTPVRPVATPAPETAASTPAAATPAPVPKAAATPAPAAAPAAKVAPGGTSVTSLMPDFVLDVKVNVGDKVSADQTMFVLEAMKMGNETVVPVDGMIVLIDVKTGDAVDTDQVMGTLS